MAGQALSVVAPLGRVGTLTFESREDRYAFIYDSVWRTAMHAFPLSPRIPLAGPPVASGVIARFLQNLLPEGRALDVAASFHRISKNNIFGLINLLGAEPVGALQFLPEGTEAERVAATRPRRPISDAELSERIGARKHIPFPLWDGKVRLSIAGFQDKLQVLIEGSQISLVEAPLASTHILKPESDSDVTPCMVANEYFCMTLASRMGLPVAPVHIRRIPEPILLIERFDRTVVRAEDGVAAATVRRRHVIDACQALDMPVALKYERNMGNTEHVRHIRDGVSYEQLFSLAGDFENPAVARQYLLRWAILQLLIGNSDAHGKNLSFFLSAAGLAPAPIYDLICVHAYGHDIEHEMAMAYGDEFRCEAITAFDLADFARRANLPGALLARELILMARKAKAVVDGLAQDAVYTQAERDRVQEIARFVSLQAERLMRIAPEVPKVDPRLL